MLRRTSTIIPIALLLVLLALNPPPAAEAQAACSAQSTTSRYVNSVAHVSTATSSGTAFYIGNNEWVTAAHVLGTSRTASIGNAHGTRTATVVGSRTDLDLAVLSASGGGAQALSFATPHLAQAVLVLGYGSGHRTSRAGVSSGLVSELYDDAALAANYIRTDAAANPGNSGGPVLDLCGHVVGVIQAKFVDTAVEGVAYAIAGDSVRAHLEGVRAAGQVLTQRKESVDMLSAWQDILIGWWHSYSDTKDTMVGTAAAASYRRVEADTWTWANNIWAVGFVREAADSCDRAHWWTVYTYRQLSILAATRALDIEGGDDYEITDAIYRSLTSLGISWRQMRYHFGECAAGR